MKRTLFAISLLAALVLGVAPRLAGQEDSKPSGSASAPQLPAASFGGSLFFGSAGNDNNDYLGRIAEYDAARQGMRPAGGADVWGNRGSLWFSFRGENRGDARDQRYSFQLDAGRWFKLRTTYDRFLFRLDHDPLSNLDAAKGTVVVRHDDVTPGVNHAPARSELTTRIEVRIPSLPFVTLYAAHRTELRRGHTQVSNLDHCANCHITSTTRETNQRMNEVTGGVGVRLGRVSLGYAYTQRQFDERGATPMAPYDAAIHPATLQKIFGNRVQFDAKNGLMPFNRIPELKKASHELKASIELPAEARLTAAAVKTRADNVDTGLGVDAIGWNSRFTIPLAKRLQFTARVRKLQLTADDSIITLSEPLAEAGPQTGKTFSQAYPAFGGDTFYNRSTISRNQVTAGAEIAYRPQRYSSIRVGYEHERVHRDAFEVERTESDRLLLTASTRVGTTLFGRMRYRFEGISDPFMHVKAAYSPVMQPNPSPGTPPSPLLGLQYFTMYAARQANLTMYPARVQTAEPSVTWMAGERSSVTLHYRFRNESNNKLNFSSWDRQAHMPGVEAWFAPAEKVNFTLAYTFQNERSRSLFVIPAFDG